MTLGQGRLEFGRHEWLTRDWRGNRPFVVTRLMDSFIFEYGAAILFFKFKWFWDQTLKGDLRGCNPLSHRGRRTSFVEGWSCDHAFSTSFWVASSPALLVMVKMAVSARIRAFVLMGLVVKTPHPAPGDGFSSIGVSSGILMLRYARSNVRWVSFYSTFDTYGVVQTWCLVQSVLLRWLSGEDVFRCVCTYLRRK